MAANGRSYNRYQYETSPRKIEPIKELPKKEMYPPKKSSTRNEKKEQEEIAKAKALEAKKKAKMVFYLMVGFVVLFTIGYRNSQINEAFTQKQKLEKQISQIKKENEQLEVNIQNNLNFSQIEALAKERLGMQKLTSKQTIYIDLPKKDYVEAATEELIIEEEPSFLESIIEFVKNIFK